MARITIAQLTATIEQLRADHERIVAEQARIIKAQSETIEDLTEQVLALEAKSTPVTPAVDDSIPAWATDEVPADAKPAAQPRPVAPLMFVPYWIGQPYTRRDGHVYRKLAVAPNRTTEKRVS